MLDAELTAPFDEARLHRRRSWDCRLSHDNRFEVRLHHALHAKLIGDSVQFIQLEAFAAPRFRQCFEGHIKTDRVSKAKAVSNSAGEAVDPNGLAFESMLLDAKIEYGRGDVDYPKRRRRNARHTRATRNGDPDLSRQLCPDVVESEG
jgi:hypothetical protein